MAVQQTPYQSFLPEVAPHCRGAPEQMVINAIRNACIDFCERSWIWIYDLDPFAIAANIQDYTLDASTIPTQSAIAEVLYGYYNGKPIGPIPRDMLEGEFPNWRTETGTTPKRFFAKDAGTTVSLIPIPNSNISAGGGSPIVPNGATFTVALKPTRASTGLPTWIYEKYLEDIAQGATYRMYAMPKKDWTNANLAGTHKALFEDAAANARQDSSKSFTRGNIRNRASGVANW